MSGPCSCQTRCVFTAHGTKPCGDPVLGWRWPFAERRGAEASSWRCGDKVRSRVVSPERAIDMLNQGSKSC